MQDRDIIVKEQNSDLDMMLFLENKTDEEADKIAERLDRFKRRRLNINASSEVTVPVEALNTAVASANSAESQ